MGIIQGDWKGKTIKSPLKDGKYRVHKTYNYYILKKEVE
jgi:hypothetical protein